MEIVFGAEEGAGSILAIKRSYLPLFSQFEVNAIKRPSFEIVGFGLPKYPVVVEGSLVS